MEYIFIIFSSSTTANKVKRLCTRDGIRDLRVVQTPKSLSKGCSYALRCRREDLQSVEQLAEEYGIRVDRKYTEFVTDAGEKEYEML